MSNRVEKELKSLIKFIEYLKKEDINPNGPVVKNVIRGFFSIVYSQGKIDYLKEELKKK